MTAPLTVLLLCLAPALTWAQTAVLTGRVTGPDGDPVKEAVVRVTNASTGVTAKANASPNGEYSLTVPAGTWDLAVPMPCCQWGSYAEKGIALKAGESRHLDVHLPWGANLGALGDDPILRLNEFRERAAVPAGPAPRMADGKPDLSGIWINVYNPDMPSPRLKPWAADLFRQRTENESKDYPGGFCLPASASSITRFFPYKFVQTSKLIVMIVESDTPGFRQIFLDGRTHPADWNPTWQGHSTGTWDGDTLVVDTVGFNDKAWLSLSGIPHSEKLHVVERIRRPDNGHLDIEVTMDDADAFEVPWKRTFSATLAPPEEEILEFICNENNTDPTHYRGK